MNRTDKERVIKGLLKDLDGDKINDIAIYDKKGNMKYLNCYSINKIPKSQMDYSSYVLQKPEDDTYKTYLTNKPKKEPTVVKKICRCNR